MPKIRYISRDLKPSSLKIVEQANAIIDGYMRQGFRLTLRQLYYQFVSRDLIGNTVQNYKRLGSIINDARLAGLIDWSAIEDRTRETTIPTTWHSPSSILDAVADQFRIDKWADQPYRPEVWIEKEALAGVIEPVCRELQISFLSCRGYTSQSEMWSSAQRLLQMKKRGQTPFILHFGDHDPSGIDMTRDIVDRLELFTHGAIKLERLALNMDQVEQYNPPPNPAKQTDARFTGYMRQFGVDESWELDALEPTVLAGLIRKTVAEWRVEDKWEAKIEEEAEHRALLDKASTRWDDVVTFLDGDE
jgi:hypothetical protein